MIKGVLFDSGGVLNYPTTGNWFISPNFYDIVDKNLFENINSRKKRYAFQNATRHISSIACVSDKNIIWDATFNMSDLFEEIAIEVSEAINFSYNLLEANNSRDYLRHIKKLPSHACEIY